MSVAAVRKMLGSMPRHNRTGDHASFASFDLVIGAAIDDARFAPRYRTQSMEREGTVKSGGRLADTWLAARAGIAPTFLSSAFLGHPKGNDIETATIRGPEAA